MNFTINLYKVLDNRNISETTKNLYVSRLLNIKNEVDPDATNLQFLNDTKAVSAYIDSISNVSTRKSYYITVYSILKKSKKHSIDIKRKYRMLMEMNRDIDNIRKKL